MITTNILQTNTLRKANKKEGIALLIALLVMGVLFGISSSLLNITLKQYQLSGIAFASETAFQAANAGIECALYHDWLNPPPTQNAFDVPSDGSEQATVPQITCMDNQLRTAQPVDSNNNSMMKSGEEQRFQFDWPGGATKPVACVEISVYKFSSDSAPVPKIANGVPYGGDCAKNTVCTVIQSRGYNVPCAERTTNARVVEREFTQVY